MDTLYIDELRDFFAVMEADMVAMKPKITTITNKDGISFLRFMAHLQTFGIRSLNRRLWLSHFFRPMLEEKTVQDRLRRGGLPGEAGHPVPDVGKATLDRILTVDPQKTSHLVKSFIWKDKDNLDGEVETIADGPGQPGDKLMREVIQGVPIAFSARAVIPQRKNLDGSIDMIGVGKYVCHDRVHNPGFTDAYKSDSIPINKIIKQDDYQTAMESFSSFILDRSEKVKSIITDLDPDLDTIAMEASTGIFSANTKHGKVFIAPEARYRNELKDMLKGF